MMRANRLQWLHGAMQNKDGRIGYLRGCYGLKKWLQKLGYGEVIGWDWHITDAGRAAVKRAIADHSKHGTLTIALPPQRHVRFISDHCKLCERDEKAFYNEQHAKWARENPKEAKEQEDRLAKMFANLNTKTHRPTKLFVNPSTFAALKSQSK